MFISDTEKLIDVLILVVSLIFLSREDMSLT